MFCFPFGRHVVIAVGLGAALAAGTALAKPAEATFYKAYYVEHEQGDQRRGGTCQDQTLSVRHR